ncbi:MAG TPA: GNAT family N-acetyltransferase [Streptosporangiaceae bacterium]|nr:GNAT family N-acetyltransferase [Streptosporangiaceae bacterium]
MSDLTWRSYADEDAPGFTTFMREMAVAAGADPGLTEDAVRSWFTSGLVRDPAADTRLVVNGDAIVASAMLAPPAGDGDRVDSFGGVLPGWRGRGIGRELLGWSFSRARQLRDELSPGANWSLDADAYATEATAFALFERFGMQPVRYWYEMAADLSVPVSPRPRPDLPVVPFSAEYTAALYAAHNEAMTDHFDFELISLADWSEQDLYQPGFRPDLTRLALDGDQVAGYVLAGEETPGRIRMNGIGTRRAWRRQGLAGSLLAEVMTASAADGQKRATLGVDSDSPTGAVSIYGRAGFEVVSSWTSYRRPLD